MSNDRGFERFLVFALACLLVAPVAFGAPKSLVKDVRTSATGDATRVVIELSQVTSQQVFTLHSPERVVIDLNDARLNLAESAWPAPAGVIKEFRSAERGNGVLRIVLEVSQPIESRSFTMSGSEGTGQRLVVDLAAPGKLPAATTVAATAPTSSAVVSTPTVPQIVKSMPKESEGRLLIVAVDAGHGGQDPGASGRRGTREKDVTLAIARKLKDAIDAEPGMKAVLTRDGDYFVPLRDRMVRAQKHRADLFISIHADSVRDRDVAGSSVYVLSAGRASNEAARMLADRENAADLLGDMTLENRDEVVASVLLDLTQNASMSASIAAADRVLAQLTRVGQVLDNDVKHASLKVLTSPGMPSMLVETAFISNPKEELRLNDARYQQRLADAMLAGVRGYFYEYPPPGTRVAQRLAQQRAERSGVGLGVIAGSVQ